MPDPAGERPWRVGAAHRRDAGLHDQTVRNVVREFERDGLDACLTRGSSRPAHHPCQGG